MLDRGINLGNVLDARRGTKPLPWPGAAALEAAGFSTVRVPVCWTDHLGDPAFPVRVDAVVDALLAQGLHVVVNVHHFDDLQPDVLHALWTRIASRYADRPPALRLELLNEPRIPPDAWNALAASTLARVREADPEREVLIGPAAANTLDALDDLVLPRDGHLSLTFHYYEPFAFTHQGAFWEPGSEAWLGTGWGSDADRAAVTADLRRARAWGERHGVAVFMGEFGAIDRAEPAARAAWTAWVRTEAERLGIGWCYWALGTEFALDADLRSALGVS